MKLTQSQIESMQEDITSDILEIFMDNNNMSMEQAMTLFYNSDTLVGNTLLIYRLTACNDTFNCSKVVNKVSPSF